MDLPNTPHNTGSGDGAKDGSSANSITCFLFAAKGGHSGKFAVFGSPVLANCSQYATMFSDSRQSVSVVVIHESWVPNT
jgi:hypothetical protein